MHTDSTMNNDRHIAQWLFFCAFAIFIMIVLGGVTRLTESGLSIVEWKPVMGTLPPIGNLEWMQEFEKYKQFPEYQKVNKGMSLEDFKTIFYYEYSHRLLGRLIGIFFLLPFLFFWFTKRIKPGLGLPLLGLFILGGLQGALGWFMVKSGLIDQPDVSHYRLALHLTFAFITFAYTLWVALDLIYPNKNEVILPLRKLARIAMVVLIIQIIYGGFVAGLNAGLIHNHWPLMSEGKLIHETVWMEQPTIIKNLTEGKSGVQFVHRTMAYVVVGLMLLLFVRSKKYSLSALQSKSVKTLVLFVFIQFILGIFTSF